MIHIVYAMLPAAARALVDKTTLHDGSGAVCSAQIYPGDSLTEVAMESNCDECRSRLNIGNMRDKGLDGKAFGVKVTPSYAPVEPLRGKDGEIVTRARD